MEDYIPPKEIPAQVRGELKEYSELMQTLLYNRGITTKEKAEAFLNPSFEEGMHDPSLMKDMRKAVARVLDAIKRNEKIVIYGDYDCDGIPGSVILHDFFKKVGFENFSVYIPHRHKEGYGLHSHAIDRFASESVSLVITVDCGISSVEAVRHANEVNIDVIITDHHIPPETLPEAYAILNPKVSGCKYPDDMLCGAAVAWKFVVALLYEVRKSRIAEVHEGWEKWLLDMAGLGTVADMVPLVGENRVFAHFGLKVLRKSPRPGLQKLLRKAGAFQQYLTEDDIGFTIAPRINAASRMGDPIEAFRLLSEKDVAIAGGISDFLHSINTERKLLVARILKEAKQVIRKRKEKDVIVVGNPKWKVGVLGIVANNIMEEFHKPVFVWGREGDMNIKGSCRSDGTVNVVELMRSVPGDIFADVGGHELAGGFSVFFEKVHLLEDVLVSGYRELKQKSVTGRMLIDKKLTVEEVDWRLYGEIEKLSPFGVGNPKPVFFFEGVVMKKIEMFGKEKNHLKILFSDTAGKRTIPAICFFAKRDKFSVSLSEGEKVNLIATVEKSVFGGKKELRLRIIDLL